MDGARDLRERLRGSLLPEPDPVPEEGDVPAAVLVPFVVDTDSLIFTKRTDELPRHAGEISFPGGLLHPEDGGVVDAALRETEEELGIPAGAVEVLGTMEPFSTHVSGISIFPVVGALVSRPAITPNPAEIAEVLEYPVARLVEVEVEREYRLPEGVWRGFVYEMPGHTIWGATGHILHAFLGLVKT